MIYGYYLRFLNLWNKLSMKYGQTIESMVEPRLLGWYEMNYKPMCIKIWSYVYFMADLFNERLWTHI
jgi:hypothetical protein